MTKEQTAVEWIADRFRQYQIEGYKCNWDEVIQTVLLAKEIEDKELAKEREKAKKLVEAAKCVMKSWNERMNNEIEEEKENKHGPYKYWSPSASMVASSEINKLRQSLTEYEKL